MTQRWANVDEATRRRLYAVGLGVVGSATVLGGLLWLIRRQVAEGDVVRVTLVHDLDDDTKALARAYLPSIQRIADQGMTHRVRFFSRGGKESPSLVGQLVPASELGAAPRYLF